MPVAWALAGARHNLLAHERCANFVQRISISVHLADAGA
jgi:hypothetical protein